MDFSGHDITGQLGYRQKIEPIMKFSEDSNAGRQGEFENPPKQGWFLGLERFKAKLDDLYAAKNTRLEKQAVAWILKTKTTVTGVWIADRLQMGHRVNASKAISRFRHSGEDKVQKLKSKILQSTA
jgi:hypothetical protein